MAANGCSKVALLGIYTRRPLNELDQSHGRHQDQSGQQTPGAAAEADEQGQLWHQT